MDSLDIEYSITAESSRTAHTGALTEAAFVKSCIFVGLFPYSCDIGWDCLPHDSKPLLNSHLTGNQISNVWQQNHALLCCLVTQSCLMLCHSMDWSLPGSSVHGILQARILEWVTVPFSRRSCRPRNRTQVSRTAGSFFTTKPPGKPCSTVLLDFSFTKCDFKKPSVTHTQMKLLSQL